MRTLQSAASFFTAAGSGKFAGRYRTGAALIFGSTTLWQSVIDRVSVSQAEEMYSRIGWSACPSGAVASTGWATSEQKMRTANAPRTSAEEGRNIVEQRLFMG